MEKFFRIHNYLIEHTQSPVPRKLIDDIDWNHRLIGIKGCRGVGKTTFLLEYAKRFPEEKKECLYINLNQFYFTECNLVDFAGRFTAEGGKVLLIDQVFKYPDWSSAIRQCYDLYPQLHIVFTGSSVMRLKEENPDLSGLVKVYYLQGYSFREYLNLIAGSNIEPVRLDDILRNPNKFADAIKKQVDPSIHLQNYLHHGYYPFFLEKRNFSENLLKTMNMMLEVDVLLIKQIAVDYLWKLRRLLYLLAISESSVTNVSQLSNDLNTSRATVMNYLKYLEDARLLNLIYAQGESFPKKPTCVYLNNSNLLYAIYGADVSAQNISKTFVFSTLHGKCKLSKDAKKTNILVNGIYRLGLKDADTIICIDKSGRNTEIPIWLFGMQY